MDLAVWMVGGDGHELEELAVACGSDDEQPSLSLVLLLDVFHCVGPRVLDVRVEDSVLPRRCAYLHHCQVTPDDREWQEEHPQYAQERFNRGRETKAEAQDRRLAREVAARNAHLVVLDALDAAIDKGLASGPEAAAAELRHLRRRVDELPAECDRSMLTSAHSLARNARTFASVTQLEFARSRYVLGIFLGALGEARSGVAAFLRGEAMPKATVYLTFLDGLGQEFDPANHGDSSSPDFELDMDLQAYDDGTPHSEGRKEFWDNWRYER